MNVILPTIPNGFFYNTSVISNVSIGYSFNKQSLGRKVGHNSFNNNATSLINAYFVAISNISENGKVDTRFSGKLIRKYLISKPTFNHTNSKVTVQLFYYISSNNPEFTFNEREKFRKALSVLSVTLAQLFQKEVNFNAIRLYYPYLNSSIFSQYLAHNASSNTFLKFHESILTNPSLHKTDLPSHICGIKVLISGRLVTETVVPRVTVKSCVIGTFRTSSNDNTTKSAQFIDYSKFITKNELGAFTVKV